MVIKQNNLVMFWFNHVSNYKINIYFWEINLIKNWNYTNLQYGEIIYYNFF